MDYGSRTFTGLIGLIALVAGIGAALSGSLELGCGALAVAAYALHLISVRRAWAEAARRAAVAEREGLSAEREALNRRADELAGRSAQVEEQWKLLRELVQERVRRRGGRGEPAAPVGVKESETSDVAPPVGGPRPVGSPSSRGHSRW
jgi:membrane protein implicated in regulation of membrane protease activity